MAPPPSPWLVRLLLRPLAMVHVSVTNKNVIAEAFCVGFSILRLWPRALLRGLNKSLGCARSFPLKRVVGGELTLHITLLLLSFYDIGLLISKKDNQ